MKAKHGLPKTAASTAMARKQHFEKSMAKHEPNKSATGTAMARKQNLKVRLAINAVISLQHTLHY